MPRGVYIRTAKTRESIRQARLGKPSPTKGMKWSLESRRRLSEARKGDRGSNWLGDNVGYSGVHKWVYKQSGKANICVFKDLSCKGQFEWSNISGEYKRDLEDWHQLCRSHHLRYDGRLRNEKGQFIKEKTWQAHKN